MKTKPVKKKTVKKMRRKDSSLTHSEMRTLSGLLQVVGNSRTLQMTEVESKLIQRGHSLTGGLSKWLVGVEKKIFGEPGRLILMRPLTGTSLTSEGKEICTAYKEALEGLEQRIKKITKKYRPRIQIGLTNSLTANLLPRVLTEDQQFVEYLADNPHIDIKVVEGEPDDLKRHVETQWVDFAIAPAASSNDARRMPFDELKRVLIFNPHPKNPSHPLAKNLAKLVRFEKLQAENGELTDPEFEQLKRCLADVTILIPPRGVMPELEDEGFLPWPKVRATNQVTSSVVAQSLGEDGTWCCDHSR